MAPKVVMGSSPGPTAMSMKAIFSITLSRDLARWSFMMASSMKGIGKIIKWMAMVCSFGPMAENTKAISFKTKRMDLVLWSGAMAGSMKDSSKMVFSTELESTKIKMDKLFKVFGIKGDLFLDIIFIIYPIKQSYFILINMEKSGSYNKFLI